MAIDTGEAAATTEGEPTRWCYALLALPLLVTLSPTLVLRRAGVADGGDETRREDFDELAEDREYPAAGAPAPAA